MTGRWRLGIITVGDEILAGRIQDTLSAELSAQLTDSGYSPTLHMSVGDAPGRLSALLRRTRDGADELHCHIVMVTGGLGPTDDDRTRHEVAEACGRALEIRQDVWHDIQRFFRSRGREAVAGNRRQAFFPEGSRVLENERGTAPGFCCLEPEEDWGCWVMPGVPIEVEGMFASQVLPALIDRFPPATPADGEVLRFFGIAESELDEWILSQLPGDSLDYHIRITRGEAEVHLPAGVTLERAAQQRFGNRCVGRGSESVAERAVQLAQRAGTTVTLVESCTGGLAAAAITEVPGASQVFERSWVTYANSAKMDEVGVPREVLDVHGAVSAECACAMATGALSAAGADVAVSITGIAGPSGGSSEKRVGTTYLALATAEQVTYRHFQFSGNRQQVRTRATATALFAIWCGLQGETPHGWGDNVPTHDPRLS